MDYCNVPKPDTLDQVVVSGDELYTSLRESNLISASLQQSLKLFEISGVRVKQPATSLGASVQGQVTAPTGESPVTWFVQPLRGTAQHRVRESGFCIFCSRSFRDSL
ncbi:hypothetical protein PAMP_013780 [Pampus punctatissimus]